MSLRKVLFWMHLTAGVTAGLIILTLSVTGILLAFERQAVAFAERDLRASDNEAQREPLPLSALVSEAAKNAPGLTASGVTVRSDRRAPVSISFGRERTLFVNRYSGRVVGEGAVSLRHFFQTTEDVHRALALKGEQRERGRAITGAANLTFLFIVLSGPILWIPRSRKAWRNAAWFRRGLRGKPRDFNWHNVLGIWSFVPLIVIVVSGVVMSYPWANALVYRTFGSEPPAPPAAASERPREGERRRDVDLGQLDRMWTVAITEADRVTPQWRTISFRLPFSRKGPVSFSVDQGSGARPDKRSQLMIDPASGQLAKHETYAGQEPGRKARAWLRWMHTGEAGGLVGQIVATIATSAAVLLFWTGIALALRRLRKWRQTSTVGEETATPA